MSASLDTSQPSPRTNNTAQEWLPTIYADPDFRACLEACDRILATKGPDYTQGIGQLHNFDEAAKFLALTPAQVLGVYLYKHVSALFTFMGKGSLKSEPAIDRVFDAINYLLLCFKMLRRK